jgi:hypothetical protein
MEKDMIALIFDPTASVEDLKCAYFQNVTKLSIKTLHVEVAIAAIKRGDTDMLTFCVHNVGVTMGVPSTLVCQALNLGASDDVMDVLDDAFACKTYKDFVTSFVVDSSHYTNAEACFHRARARYNAIPTKRVIGSLVLMPSIAEFDKWLAILRPLFDDKVWKSYMIDKFTLTAVMFCKTTYWKDRISKLEGAGFCINIDLLKDISFNIADAEVKEFVKIRMQKRGAERAAITKKYNGALKLKRKAAEV